MCRAALLCTVLSLVTLQAGALRGARPQVQPEVETGVRPFPLERVRLLDGPFRDALERDRRYLHSLDPDRLLHTWRRNAGLPGDAEPLGGWEAPDREVRGHTMGHYLSACALVYAGTGDEKLKARADHLVAELAKCQDALDSNGYLSAFPESFIDRVENSERVWAPYYTLHKVFAGLLDVYRYCDNRQALSVAEGMARWLQGRLADIDREQMQRILNRTEQGGMNDALANLYAFTGKEEYLELAQRFQQDHYVKPLAAGEDNLTGEHANSFIPNIIGAARLYELTGNERDRKVARRFWNLVVPGRTYCTGGTSESEHFHEPGTMPLSDYTQEFCCTYNMLKLTRHLFCWDPKPKYVDYYRRALWNDILASQDPERGMMMYFLPLTPGCWKAFSTPTNSFWCCTGTGMESHARYGRNIYFHDADGLYVNLFIASELDWRERGVRIRQETEFPRSDTTTLTVETDRRAEFTLRVHVPWWATDGVSATVNGEPIDAKASPSGYLGVRRGWRDGDELRLSMPMRLHTEALPDQPNRVAFTYGPVVLAGRLSGEGLTGEKTYTTRNWYDFPDEELASVPTLVHESEKLSDWIKPVAGRPLTFRITGQSENITLVPIHRLFGHRYAIYWPLYEKGSRAYREMQERRRARERLEARTVDRVEIGRSESEEAHNLKGERTSRGTHAGRRWRHATDGGWFSYELKVLPDRQMTLLCTYWGSDSGPRTFDVLVEGRKIATQTLDRNRPGEFFRKEYEIHRELTRGRERITVKFDGHEGNFAGGVFGCAVLKAEGDS